jgi:hypothetical protein
MDDAPEARLKYQGLTLSYSVEGKSAELRFQGVAAFCFTEFDACQEEHVRAYDKLLVMGESDWLKQIRGGANTAVGDVRHYRIFVDEVGAYDVIARSVELPK